MWEKTQIFVFLSKQALGKRHHYLFEFRKQKCPNKIPVAVCFARASCVRPFFSPGKNSHSPAKARRSAGMRALQKKPAKKIWYVTVFWASAWRTTTSRIKKICLAKTDSVQDLLSARGRKQAEPGISIFFSGSHCWNLSFSFICSSQPALLSLE